jgi:hypothetical protein
MKVKLLKKVRKRFQIVKIIRHQYRPTEYEIAIEKKLDLPYYSIRDLEGFWDVKYEVKTFEEAHDKLIQIIIREYEDKYRKKDLHLEKKVWYNK